MPSHRRKCCRCGNQVKGKMANGYVSWYVGDDRSTFYTRWSLDCFADAIYPVIEANIDAEAKGGSLCVVCGTAIEGEPELVYLTLFPPKQDQVDYEFEVCPDECWEKLRNELSLGGEFRADRSGRVGAQAQAPTPTESAWSSFKL